ncbi:MAG: hypothetical protein IBX52_06240 [Bacterioplanes sp.]|nr:hypothetical protein [Bacterioplanes sp.]
MHKWWLMMFMMGLPFTVAADSVIRLQGIAIQGNSEEPNMMVVTSWQPAYGTERFTLPIRGYRQQWLQPVDRQRLQREQHYSRYYAVDYRDRDDNATPNHGLQ